MIELLTIQTKIVATIVTKLNGMFGYLNDND